MRAAKPIIFMLLTQAAVCARLFALAMAGNSSAAITIASAMLM
jgi:hypothetical protein